MPKRFTDTDNGEIVRPRSLPSSPRLIRSEPDRPSTDEATTGQFRSASAVSSHTQLVFVGVVLCFALSGFAALIYQAAWLKKLGVIFGTSHTAVATVLSAYMGGLALGAAVAARYIRYARRPILVYGVLEALIAVSALMVPLCLTGAQTLLVAMFGNQPQPVSADGFGQSAYYLLATFVILAIPTAAMGATLPLLSRHAISEDSQIGPRIGILYGVNTFGAVAGALAAGFFLLPQFGLFGALFFGAAINGIVFLIALALSRAARAKPPPLSVKTTAQKAPVIFHWILPVMLMSGIVAFTLEVLWTRLLSHVFGGTVYAFSIMLASFLAGIAIGGMIAGRLAAEKQKATQLFIGAQLLIALLSFVSYSYIDYWVPVFAGLSVKAVYAFGVIVPSTLFIGATYPLAVRIACDRAEDTAATSGHIYAWNTVGAILGALLTGFITLPAVGFEGTIKTAMFISVTLALVTALFLQAHRNQAITATMLALLAILTGVSPQRPDNLIHAYLKKDIEWGEERFYGVGRSATILMREAQGFINLSSNGLSEASIGRIGMPPFNLSQKWLAGLPSLARPNAESMLIIGYGGGVALEGAPPSIRNIDVIELEPMVIRANEAVVSDRGKNPLDDPRVTLILNDARNALMLTDKKYDIIVSQPSHPWTGGASHLYTKEFLSLSKSHLNEDGVFLQWINSQFVDEALLKILMATLIDQFAYVELYQPERQVLFFLASDHPIEVWDGGNGASKALANYPRHFQRMGLRAVEDVVAMTSLDNVGVRVFSAGAPINSDNRNRLAFFSRARADGLSAEEMGALFKEIDPLTNQNSRFHDETDREWNKAYIAEQLLQANFIQRTFQFARATKSADMQATIDALGHYYSEETEQAEASFASAIAENPDNQAAKFGLLRLYLGDLAERRIPEHIAKLANEQRGPERRVLEGWVFGAAGAFDRLKDLDPELAMVEPTSLAYPIAVKLRVDWRIVQSQGNEDPEMAREALELLDDLLASYWNLDLYVLRAGAAYLAGDTPGFIESVATVTRQVNARLAALEKARSRMPADEADNLKMRLHGMRALLVGPFTQSARSRADKIAKDIDDVIARL